MNGDLKAWFDNQEALLGPIPAQFQQESHRQWYSLSDPPGLTDQQLLQSHEIEKPLPSPFPQQQLERLLQLLQEVLPPHYQELCQLVQSYQDSTSSYRLTV